VTVVRGVGFYRDLPFGPASAPSVLDTRRSEAQAYEVRLVAYLRAGHGLLVSPALSSDVVDGAVIGPVEVLTDGTWAWPSDLAHYVERYHCRVPDEFIAHARGREWRVPDVGEAELRAIDLAGLGFVEVPFNP